MGLSLLATIPAQARNTGSLCEEASFNQPNPSPAISADAKRQAEKHLAQNRKRDAIPLLLRSAEVEYKTGFHDDAVKNFERARTLSRETGDVDCEAAAESGLATIDRYHGRYDAAIKGYTSAIDKYHQGDKVLHEAETRRRLAYALSFPSSKRNCDEAYVLAQKEYERAQGLRHSGGNTPLGSAQFSYAMADLDFRFSRFAAAKENYASSATSFHKKSNETGAIVNEGHALRGLGNVELHDGHFSAARLNYENAKVLLENDGLGMAHVEYNLAELELRQENWDDAYRLFGDAARRYQKEDNPRSKARALRGMAEVELRNGYREQARQKLDAARELLKEAPDEMTLAGLLRVAGQLARSEADLNRAAQYFRESEGTASRACWALGKAEALADLGHILFLQNRESEGREKYDLAVKLAERDGARFSEAQIRLDYGHMLSGKFPDDARKQITIAAKTFDDLAAPRAAETARTAMEALKPGMADRARIVYTYIGDNLWNIMGGIGGIAAVPPGMAYFRRRKSRPRRLNNAPRSDTTHPEDK